MVKFLIAAAIPCVLLLSGCGVPTTTPDSNATLSFAKIQAGPVENFPELAANITKMRVEARRNGNILLTREVPYTTREARLTISPGLVNIRLMAMNELQYPVAEVETTITAVSGLNQLPTIILETKLRAEEPANLRIRLWVPDAWPRDIPTAPAVFLAHKGMAMPDSRIVLESEVFSGMLDTFSLRQFLTGRFSTPDFIKQTVRRRMGTADMFVAEFISNPVMKPTHNFAYSVARDGKRNTIIFSCLESDWGKNENFVFNEMMTIMQLIYCSP